MCGIAGIVSNNSIDYSLNIQYMNTSQNHRGPDDSGVLKLNGSILGHTRLSIIDMNSGQQPMTCNDRSIAITFNGEIYGYKDIKKNLNYSFNTQSDTEVILALYKKCRIDTVSYTHLTLPTTPYV